MSEPLRHRVDRTRVADVPGHNLFRLLNKDPTLSSSMLFLRSRSDEGTVRPFRLEPPWGRALYSAAPPAVAYSFIMSGLFSASSLCRSCPSERPTRLARNIPGEFPASNDSIPLPDCRLLRPFCHRWLSSYSMYRAAHPPSVCQSLAAHWHHLFGGPRGTPHPPGCGLIRARWARGIREDYERASTSNQSR